jgi:protein SCO1
MTTQKPKSKTLLTGVLIIALFLIGYSAGKILAKSQADDSPTNIEQAADTAPSGGAQVTPPQLLEDFTLTSQTGEAISLSELRGKTVLMFFGYTHCPDVCPTTLADYRLIKQNLAEDAENVEFVFVSVDGSRDTPDVVAEYLARFDEDFIGMTGDPAQLRDIGNAFGLVFSEQRVDVGHDHAEGEADHELDDQNYFVEHTSPSFLIDAEGYLQMLYFYGTKPEVVAEGIRDFLPQG